MAKRHAIILLESDDEKTGDSNVQSDPSMGIHLVSIKRDNLKPDAPLIGIAAHELGHVLASLYGTAAAKADAVNRGNGSAYTAIMHLLGPTKKAAENMLAAENEAWELAEQMVGKDNVQTREVDTATYRDAFPQ